jgi:hypothetical protein
MARPGATTKAEMARIGHSTPGAALVHQHATEDRARALADFLEDKIVTAGRVVSLRAERVRRQG